MKLGKLQEKLILCRLTKTSPKMLGIRNKRKETNVEMSTAKRRKVSSSAIKTEDTTESSEDEDDSDRQESKISEFEKLRLKNIQDNASFLASIGINGSKAKLKMLTQKKKTEVLGLKKEKREKSPPLPRRQSSRLRRIDADGVQLPPREPPLIFTPIQEHERKPAGPLEATKCLKNVSDESVGTKLLESVNKMADSVHKVKIELNNDSFPSFIKGFKNLKLTEKTMAKVVKERIFSVAIHPSEDRVLVCAGDKWGHLGIWALDSGIGDDGVFMYEPHSRPVNGLEFDKHNPSKLYSCSYDGTVRCLDFEKKVFDEIYATPDEERVYAFAWQSPQTLVLGQSSGDMAIKDMRTNSTTAESICNIHTRYTVKCVGIHPLKDNILATSSTDGTVKIWDLRKMKGKNPTCLDDIPHSKSVDSAYFSPITGKYLLTTSWDMNIRVFDSTDPSNMTTKHRIHHNNHTGRWLTNFRATWHPRREDAFIVGSMDRPRKIEIWGAETGALAKNITDTELLGSVNSINVFHPTRNIIVGGNSSGKVHIFK